MAKLKCDSCRHTEYRAVRSAYPGEPCPRFMCDGTLTKTRGKDNSPSRIERGSTRTRHDRKGPDVGERVLF